MTSEILQLQSEPTLYDVLEAMKSGFSNLEEYIKDQVNEVRRALSMELGAVKIEVRSLSSEISETNRRLGKVETAVLDLQDDVKAVTRAVDKDAISIINYGRRITRLEKAM